MNVNGVAPVLPSFWLAVVAAIARFGAAVATLFDRARAIGLIPETRESLFLS